MFKQSGHVCLSAPCSVLVSTGQASSINGFSNLVLKKLDLSLEKCSVHAKIYETIFYWSNPISGQNLIKIPSTVTINGLVTENIVPVPSKIVFELNTT